MVKLDPTPKLDKKKLVEKIKEKFLNKDQYMFQRYLQEFVDKDGNYLGDNFIETTFEFREGKSPIIYEITGPFDMVSKKYAAVARIWNEANLIYQYNHNDGIAQRTAAITWVYLDVLGHKLGKVLIWGPGNISTKVVDYLKHFNEDLKQIDYVHYEKKNEDFESKLKKLDVEANLVKNPDVGNYDTIILATTTKEYCLTLKDFKAIKKGSVVVSLCTSSVVGEIQPECYGLDGVQIFLDYEESKSFTTDMKKVVEGGFIKHEIYLEDILKDKVKIDKDSKINLIRLTGTPMQNIAVMEMMMEKKGVRISI